MKRDFHYTTTIAKLAKHTAQCIVLPMQNLNCLLRAPPDEQNRLLPNKGTVDVDANAAANADTLCASRLGVRAPKR